MTNHGCLYHEIMATYNISEIIDLIPSSKLVSKSGFDEESEFDAENSINQVLAQPLEFPPLQQAILEEDTVCIPVEPGIPLEESVAAMLAHAINQIGVAQERITVLLPEGATEQRLERFRQSLQQLDCSDCQVEMHRASDPECQGYLGPSQSGEPISLNARLVHADFVLPVCRAKPSGWKSQTDFLYPYYSDLESQKRFFKLNPRHRIQMNQEVQRWLGTCFQLSVATRYDWGQNGSIDAVLGTAIAGESSQVNRAVKDYFQSRADRLSSLQNEGQHDLVIAAMNPHLCLTREEITEWVSELKELCKPRGSVVLLWNDDNLVPGLLDGGSEKDSLSQDLLTEMDDRSFFLQSSQPLLRQLGMSRIGEINELEKLIERHESVLVIPDFINDFAYHRSASPNDLMQEETL